MAYRIQRSERRDSIVFALSGEMDGPRAVVLEELLAREPDRRITLDMKDVTFADRAAVQFLARAESPRIRIVNCPEYVRSWMAAEKEL